MAVQKTRAVEAAPYKSRGQYLLAIDPEALPKSQGWYRVERGDDINFIPVPKENVLGIFEREGWHSLLYVDKSTGYHKATEEGAARLALVAYNCKFWNCVGPHTDQPEDDILATLLRAGEADPSLTEMEGYLNQK